MIPEKKQKYLSIIGILLPVIFLFLVYPLLNLLFYKVAGLQHENASSFFFSRLCFWLCLFLCFLYANKIEKRNLLLWKEQKYKPGVYLVSIIAIYFILMIGLQLIHLILFLFHSSTKSAKLLETLNLLRDHHWLLVFTAFTAAVTEELIFRGYLQPRVELITKNPWLSIIIVSAVFGLLHYGYGTLTNIVGPFFIGVIWGAYYLKYRNIKLLIVFHFLWDLAILYADLRIYHK